MVTKEFIVFLNWMPSTRIDGDCSLVIGKPLHLIVRVIAVHSRTSGLAKQGLLIRCQKPTPTQMENKKEVTINTIGNELLTNHGLTFQKSLVKFNHSIKQNAGADRQQGSVGRSEKEKRTIPNTMAYICTCTPSRTHTHARARTCE